MGLFWRNFGILKQSALRVKAARCTVLLTEIRRHENTSSGSSSTDKSGDGTFTADDMEINIVSDEELRKKPDFSTLKFGTVFSDYMFSVKWDTENGWGIPKIAPVKSFQIHPAAKCLHYAVQVIESFKAYKGIDGNIRIFRPDLNMDRLLLGAKRLVLPSFDPNELIECVKRLVKLEQEWVPDLKHTALLIRPVYVGTDPTLGVAVAKSALLYVLLSPVGSYFAPDFKSASVLADPKYSRSWPGGSGDLKLGGNYGHTIYIQRAAEKRKHQLVLWLHGKNNEITGVHCLNIFFVIRNESGGTELVTPPLNGLIFPGVTRQSIIDLCQKWKDVQVVERNITIEEVKELLDQKKLKEMFGTGSMCITCPISSIFFEGSKYDVPTVKQDKPLYDRINTALGDIYYGRKDDPWGVKVD
ncbi:Branched-chain-amino-acid aminotransferase, cytosolic [Orchesella cincta]|uniref:branched-chain-amino-acid transaminase n=1 Tax=Orchesella cincta TaxID=48709 RepID=A0A1D2N0N9_ORCCI|nr:Branched-chain-amino-acid aminotransferase, cytosolic [Orchesella cincta]